MKITLATTSFTPVYSKEANLCKQPLSADSRAAFPGQSGPY